MLSPPRKKHRSRSRLSPDQILPTLEATLQTEGSPEIAILHLLDKYDLNLDILCSGLKEKFLQVSFSRVQWKDVAHFVGLDHAVELADAPKFQMRRARLPVRLMDIMHRNCLSLLRQYGPPGTQTSEEAISRSIIAPLFTETINLFRYTVRDNPEPLIQGRIVTKGRMKYQFIALGSIVILVIEAKFSLGAPERLNAIAQVIAEMDACDYVNNKLGHHLPIYAMLSDGQNFEFFRYNGSEKSPFSRGVFGDLNAIIPLFHLESPRSPTWSFKDHVQHVRPIAESIFYVILLGYEASLEALIENERRRLVAEEEATGTGLAENQRIEELTTAWQLAIGARERTLLGDERRLLCQWDSADAAAEEGCALVKQSVAALPVKYKPYQPDEEVHLNNPDLHKF